MTEREPLGKWVQPNLSEARLTRQWAHIRDHYQPTRKTARRWVAATTMAGALVLTAAVVAFGLRPEPSVSAWDGAVIESRGEALALSLDDGSRVDLAPSSRLEMVSGTPERVSLDLRGGAASFEVTKNPRRRFSVVAKGVEVEVIGTRFSVAIAPEDDTHRVVVSVEEGVVAARVSGDPSSEARLTAGQTWSAVAPGPKPASTDEPRSAKVEEGVAASATQPASDSARVTPKATIVGSSAKSLFERANAARQEGDQRAAARAYETLLTSFPGDSRAGLAAFELGRLRMDAFGDASGAAKALSRAIQLAPGSGFRQDAMARLVRAYDTMGSKAACERARDAYLQSFPSGIHSTAVRRSCSAER